MPEAVQLCLSIEIQEGLSYPRTLALTRDAESLGFNASLLAEHYYPSGALEQYSAGPPDRYSSGAGERYRGGPGERDSADAWIYLAALARDTRTIRLGTLVSPVTFRHPVVLAKMAATLDHVSGGRAELGIGAGWLEAEHRAFGFDFLEPARRVDLVEEQLAIINGLWSSDGAPFSYRGTHYTLQDAFFTPNPVQRPRPTIIVGGRTTSRRLPRLAARYADDYVVGQPSPDAARQTRALLDRACLALERDPQSLRLDAFVPLCIGTSRAEVDGILRNYRQDNPQYVRMMDDLSTWLIGTPDDVRAQIQALAEAGIDRLMLSVNTEIHRQMLPLIPRD